MRILHYSLGLPPYRSGGLTRYATDLMKEQVKQGHIVSLLYPGGMRFCKGPIIKRCKLKYGISVFEILNPIPVPLYHGIKLPEKFVVDDKDRRRMYEMLLDKTQPQIFHIHTLMGLSSTLLEVAKQRGIKIVFSTHDFFGLCLRCTFIDITGQLCKGASPLRCAWCNQNSKGISFLRFRNEPMVIRLKNKLHRSYHEENVTDQSIQNLHFLKGKEEGYKCLLDYYRKLLAYVNKFHFNSVVTEEIYTRFLGDMAGEVIPITNSSIKDNRDKGFTNGRTLKMMFVGHTDVFKGFPLLKSVLMEMQDYNWQLDVWGGNIGLDSETDKIRYRGRYSQEDLPSIYANCTIVVVPSKWYETFSFITLEALSYGVPVLVSDHVGAKTIIENYDSSFVFTSKEELKNKLKVMMNDRSAVIEFHNKILAKPWCHDMSKHCMEIIERIYD